MVEESPCPLTLDLFSLSPLLSTLFSMSPPDFSIVSRPILNDEDVDQALLLLSWMATQEHAAEARRKELEAQQKAADSASFQIQIEETSFTYAEVRKSLDSALKEYAKAQRLRLFAKRQSARFAHGEIKTRKGSPSVSLREETTEEQALALLDDPRYVRVTREIDFAAIKSDRQKGLLTDDQLLQWGLVYDSGEDRQTITINPK